MLRFGYDKWNEDTWEIIEPNGLIGQERIEELFIQLKIPYNIYHRTSYEESQKLSKGLDPLSKDV